MTMDVEGAGAGLNARNDPRHVVADPDASYFGTKLNDSSPYCGRARPAWRDPVEDWLGALATRS